MCGIFFPVTLLLLSVGIVGCGGSSRPATGDDGSGHGASYACGTEQEPATLVLKDLKPGIGETVLNRNITEQFTVVDAPFMVNKFNFVFSSKHTAGTFTPSPLQMTAVPDGKDLVYSGQIDSWSTPQGHVEAGLGGLLANENDCIFQFPSTIFSYDIVSP